MKCFYEVKNMKAIIALSGAVILTFAGVTLAADADKGKEVFDNNCSACHSGGGNALMPGKTLSKADLEKNKMNSAEAIIKQVTDGKTPMPAFGKLGSITTENIANVAAYVLKQAEADWK